MNSKNLRIMLVEDEEDIASLIQLHLEELNADIKHYDRGDTALKAALANDWDLIILDLRLPGLSGLDVCRQLREQGDQTPILMLTAKSTELDRVLGLELGADDYVTKPFSPIELLARVKAILRRMSQLKQGSVKDNDLPDLLEYGALKISVSNHRVSVNDLDIDVTAKEFDLLLHFIRHPGRVFTRSELLDKVWGYGHEGYEHTVNSHINRLRTKIETDPASPTIILTVWGVGYKFDDTAVVPA